MLPLLLLCRAYVNVPISVPKCLASTAGVALLCSRRRVISVHLLALSPHRPCRTLSPPCVEFQAAAAALGTVGAFLCGRERIRARRRAQTSLSLSWKVTLASVQPSAASSSQAKEASAAAVQCDECHPLGYIFIVAAFIVVVAAAALELTDAFSHVRILAVIITISIHHYY